MPLSERQSDDIKPMHMFADTMAHRSLQDQVSSIVKPLIPPDAEERVTRAFRQWNQIIREHIRNETALKLLQEAVALEDRLAYDEPSVWFIPVRESLGGVLLRAGNYAEAERVFRADLERNKRNGRSLFGLLETLKAQKKTEAARAVQKEFEAAWKNADTKLTVAEL